MKTKIVFIIEVLIICLLCLKYSRGEELKLVGDTTTNLLLTNINSSYNYCVLEDNRVECDLATFSNIYMNMVEDGFEMSILKDESNSDGFDILATRDDVTCRMRWLKSGYLANISKPYEKSYLPVTYIIE